MKLAIAVLLMLAAPACAYSTLEGRVTVEEGGKARFEGLIVRDGVNVSLEVLNVARRTPIKEQQHVMVELDELVLEPTDGGYIFSLHLPTVFERFDLVVDLPEDAGIREVSSSLPYRREGTDFIFNETMVETPRIDILFSYGTGAAETKDSKMDYTPIFLGLSLLILAAAVILRGRGRRMPVKVKQDILATLNPREKAVVELLASEGGRTTQTRLRQKLGIPKSSLSNLVQDLEQRNLIKRYEHGSTKDIELQDRVKE